MTRALIAAAALALCGCFFGDDPATCRRFCRRTCGPGRSECVAECEQDRSCEEEESPAQAEGHT